MGIVCQSELQAGQCDTFSILNLKHEFSDLFWWLSTHITERIDWVIFNVIITSKFNYGEFITTTSPGVYCTLLMFIRTIITNQNTITIIKFDCGYVIVPGEGNITITFKCTIWYEV